MRPIYLSSPYKVYGRGSEQSPPRLIFSQVGPLQSPEALRLELD